MVLTWDAETTTKHKGNPYTKSNRLISYAVQSDDEKPSFHYYTDLEFTKALKVQFEQAKWIVGFNLKFDLTWARRRGVQPPKGVRIWDCQIAEFLIRGQQGPYPSLNEALARFELGTKDDKVAEYWALGIDTQDIPVDELRFYNCLDVELTYKLYKAQTEYMLEHMPKVYRLCVIMGLDLLVLQEMEWNGLKLNVELCKEKAAETAKELEEVSDELFAYCPTTHINLGSGHQLSCFLYGGGYQIKYVESIEQLVYKSGAKKGQTHDRTNWAVEDVYCEQLFTPIKGSETKLVSKVGDKEYPVYATGEDILKQLKKPTRKHRRIIELLLKRAELEKLLSTYYGAMPKLIEKMEWEDDTLHGQLNQVVARTGRLSSSAPNQQNFSADVDELLVTRYDT